MLLRTLSLIALLWTALDRSAAQSQVPSPPLVKAPSSATQIISPVALATWVTKPASNGLQIDLLVIWRGSPGWFLNGQGNRGATGSRDGILQIEVEYAGIPLRLELRQSPRTAMVQGKSVSIAHENVILVDDVDASSGHKIAGVLSVDSQLLEPGRIEPMLRRSVEVSTFLRCETRVPQVGAQPMLDHICAAISGR